MPIFAVMLAISLFITPAIEESIDEPPPISIVTTSSVDEGYVRAIRTVPIQPKIKLLDKPETTSIGNGQCVDYVKYRLGYAVEEWISAKNFYENYTYYKFVRYDSPVKNSVVVTDESPYWHVAIVESFTETSITISEQNYIKGKIGERTLSRDNKKIKGYFVWQNH